MAVLAARAGRAKEPAPAFQPGEISIGEPIALPAGGSAAVGEGTAAGATAAPGNDPRAALPPAASAAALVPGSGWLGLAVAESNVPGRWRIEEVTPGGPAARAGIVAGDELRAVNGLALASAEEVSQALTSISAGQDVRVAVARTDRVSDVVLRAEPRPAPRAAEPSRFAAQPPAPPAQLPAPAPANPAPVTNPDWQAARAADPVPTGSRFGRPAEVQTAPLVDGPSGGSVPGAAVATGPAAQEPNPPGRIALGVRTVPIDPALQARFKLTEPAGAYVIGVVEDLPAAKAGVPPGSVIVAVGDQPVRSPLELTRLVTSGPVDRPVSVQFLLPGGEPRRATVVLQPLDAPLERALTGAPQPVTEPPALRPGPVPRRAERNPGVDDAIRAEIRGLRTRLDRLERLLLAPPAGRGP